MPLAWKDVASKEEYKTLGHEEKIKAQSEYFDSVVSPNVPIEKRGEVRTQFFNHAKSLDIKSDSPGLAGQVLKSTKKAAGYVLGAVNSPLAFIWGSQAEQFKRPEDFEKMGFLKSAVESTKAGARSAFESATKEGSWGTLYGDYYKAVKGKTIEEDLPKNLKWAAPTIEFFANMVSDPLIGAGEISRLTSLKIPKGWKGKIPATVMDDLSKIDKLSAAEKARVEGEVRKSILFRKFNLQPYEKRVELMDRLRVRRGEAPIRPEIKPGVAPVQKPAPFVGEGKIETGEELKRRLAERTRPEVKSPIVGEPTKPGVFVGEKSPGSSREFKMRLVKNRAAHSTSARATGGLVLGVDEDENGNLRYDIGKGLAGSLLVAGGLKLATKSKGVAAETIAKSPAWSKVHGAIGKQDKTFSFVGLMSKINTALFDRFGPIKNVSKAGYDEARIFSSYKDIAAQKFDDLKEIFSKVKDHEVVVSDYIAAARMESRGARGIKNPNSVSAAEARQAMREIETHFASKGGNPEDLKNALSGFHEWTNKYILQEAVDSGVLSKEAYRDIVSKNKFYATFDVLDHLPDDVNKIPALPSKEYFSVANQKVIQSMVGTEKKIANPIEATIRKFSKAQEIYARNRVATALVDDPGMAEMIRPVAMSMEELGQMQKAGQAPILHGAWSKKEFDVIARFKDGRVERFLVPKEIADSFKQLTPYQAPKVIQAINAVFRAAATTLSPAFTIGNASRDAFMAYTTAPVYKTTDIFGTFQKDWAKGAWNAILHEVGKPSLVDDYVKSGGSFGYAGAEVVEAAGGKSLSKTGLFKKSIARGTVDVIKSPLTLMEKINSVVELAPRLGTFDRAQIRGASAKDAAMMARQATIDFNRGGTLTKVANQFIPFLNARVQARVTMFEALKKDPKSTAAKIAVSTVIPGSAAYAWNKTYYSELYDEIPDYIKKDYFCIIYDKTKDENGKDAPKYIVIAKGDVGQMAWNPIEFGLEKQNEKDPESIQKFAINYLSDLSPVEFAREGEVSASKAAGGLLPPVVKAPLEHWGNLKFYQGTEIVPYWMGKTKPPELQYKEATPETYKYLGSKLKVSPLVLQNYASNILAGYGREGFDPKAMLDGISGRVVKTKGGSSENKAFVSIKKIEDGYHTAMAYAQEASKTGDKKLANNIMNEWNGGLKNTIEEYNKANPDNQDKGGLRRSYLFTPAKRKNILLVRKEEKSALDKRLTRGR